ncbi:TPA: signal peptidase I [archaeon]|nr:signal peptidase I [Candidatus Undinarchaeales archaeon SRR5007147.bin71]
MDRKEIAETVLYLFFGFVIALIGHSALGYALDTEYPVVSVVSESMEHDDPETYSGWFIDRNFNETELENWPFNRGMNKGDLVLVKGSVVSELNAGDVIVYRIGGGKPIIHRIVWINDSKVYTKGDNNKNTDQEGVHLAPPVQDQHVQGRAVFRIPLLGWIKIAFMNIVGLD